MLREYKTLNDFLKKYFLLSNAEIVSSQKKLSVLNSFESSYSQNNFSSLFYYCARNKSGLQEIREFGVLGCYSLSALTIGAIKNNPDIKIYGHDLFEDYPFNSFKLSDALMRLENLGISKYIELIKEDVIKSGSLLAALASSDITHIDLSNDGNIFEMVLKSNLKPNSIILLEGGSLQRDKNGWISKYNAREINPLIKKFSNDLRFNLHLINDFPSILLIESL